MYVCMMYLQWDKWTFSAPHGPHGKSSSGQTKTQEKAGGFCRWARLLADVLEKMPSSEVEQDCAGCPSVHASPSSCILFHNVGTQSVHTDPCVGSKGSPTRVKNGLVRA